MQKSFLVIMLVALLGCVSEAQAQRLKRTDAVTGSNPSSTDAVGSESLPAGASPGSGLSLRGINDAPETPTPASSMSVAPPSDTGLPQYQHQGQTPPPTSYSQPPASYSQPSASYSQPASAASPPPAYSQSPASYSQSTAMNAKAEPELSRQRTAVRIQSAPVLGVSQNDLQLLAHHDIVLMIDKSSSMKERDCPGGLSRWEWCQQQTMNLSRATSGLLPDGLSVVLFSTGSHVFTKVSMSDIPRIFTSYSPGGFTNESGAVDRVFTDYFQRRQGAHTKIKPLLIAVITDGLPTDPHGLRDVIIDATKNVHPGEMKMTFLQVGSDPKGIYFVREMDQQLVSEGAAFDMVSSKTFPDLLRGGGLTKALVDCITEHGSR